MKFIKNILGRILAVWALITFVVTFLIIFLPSMIAWLLPDPLGQRYFIGVARIWMSVWITLTGCPFRIRNKNVFKKNETYIVVCNHNSMMDVPLSSPFIPGPNKTIAKSSFLKVPLFNFYYMKGGVMVNRKNEVSRRRSFEKMQSVLAQGIHMCIYPEGTRNRTTEPLKKFHDGAFRLAIATGKSIIPGVILHTKKVLPVTKPFFFWPGRVEMHFLPPISPEGLTQDALKEKVFQTMKDYFVAND